MSGHITPTSWTLRDPGRSPVTTAPGLTGVWMFTRGPPCVCPEQHDAGTEPGAPPGPTPSLRRHDPDQVLRVAGSPASQPPCAAPRGLEAARLVRLAARRQHLKRRGAYIRAISVPARWRPPRRSPVVLATVLVASAELHCKR
jgi:hypothetical protein